MKDTWRHCNGTVIYSRKPPVVLWSLVCTARVIKQKGKIHCKWHWTPLVVTQNNFQQKNLLGNEWWRAVGSIKYGEKRLPLNSFWERGNFPHKYYDFRHEAIYEGAQRMCNKLTNQDPKIFVISCMCWDTSENTGLWQLPNVSSSFKKNFEDRATFWCQVVLYTDPSVKSLSLKTMEIWAFSPSLLNLQTLTHFETISRRQNKLCITALRLKNCNKHTIQKHQPTRMYKELKLRNSPFVKGITTNASLKYLTWKHIAL